MGCARPSSLGFFAIALTLGAWGCATGPAGGQASGGETGIGTGGAGDLKGTGGATGGNDAISTGGRSASGGIVGSGGLVGMGGVGSGGSPGGSGGNNGSGSGGHGGAASGGAGGAIVALIHPGGFLTEAEMEKIRSNVAAGKEPWASAWAALKNSDAGVNSQPNVTANVTDSYAIQNQGHAAYVLAIKWVASGDIAYATASKRILDGWVNTVTSMITTTTLRTGIGANQMANAAEIIAHGFNGAAGWPAPQVAKAKDWFKTVVWPVIGQANAQRSSNWGTSAMAGCMSTAIFADDLSKFTYTVNAYKNGFTDAPDGCSGVTQYVCEPTGQPTEAGRDQGHPQGGVGHLVETALMAWNQRVNLVAFANNRVVAGMEYLAKYNLGHDDVPYDPNFPDPCNVHPSWATISPTGRGSFSPVYEMADKLFNLAAVPHPYTTQVLSSVGYVPETTSADHPGSGTLISR